MKPLLLKMDAFGPYSGTVTISFDDLQGHKLFLIHGPTGAGKTTILDAIVYALYGQSSGGQRDGSDMRSDYAQPTQETLVSYTFAIGDKVYRIERQPKQEVKKLRGEGTKIVQPVAKLFQQQGAEWNLLTDRSAEIKTKIHDIIGFDVAQFLQVVLLPQGDFRKLLLANTSEREKIMNTLFRTDKYNLFQTLLGERRGALYAQYETAQKEQERLLEEESVPTVENLKTKISDTKAQIQTAMAEHKEAKQKEGDITHRLQVKRRQNEITSELEKIRKQLEILKSDAEKVEKARGKVAILQQAESVQPLRNRFLETENAYTHTQALVQEQEKELQKILEVANRLTLEREKIETRRAQYKANMELISLDETQIKQLEAVEALHAELQKVENEWDFCIAEEKKITKELDEVRNAIKHIEEDIQTAEEKKEAISSEVLKKGDWKAVLAEYERYEKEQSRLNAEEEILVAEEKAMVILSEKAQKAEALYKKTKLLFDKGKYFYIAKELQSGVECPVCGSTTHPQLAKAPEVMIEEAEVVGAAENWEHLQKEQITADSKCHTLRLQLEEAKQVLQKSLSPSLPAKEEAIQNIAHIEAAEIEYKTIQNALTRLRGTKQEKAEALENWQQKRETIVATRAGKEGSKERLLSQLQALMGTMPADIRTKEILATEIDELSRYNVAFEQEDKRIISEEKENTENGIQNKATLETLSNTAMLQEKQQFEASSKYMEKLKTCELTEADLLLLIPEIPSIKEVEETVKNYDLQCNDSASRQNQLREELEKLPDEALAEMELQALQASSAESTEQLMRKLASIEKDESISQSRLDTLHQLHDKNSEYLEQYKVINALSELANGGKGGLQGVTFERFVLGAILEDVTTAANLQLRKMSRGRYTLQRADMGASGRGNKGLDIEVYDSYTGFCRAAGTLSGGETFLASLSLALGLADVVQSYSGGIRLDTIFVDEGFGTLDPETLDVALEALVSLQESGRLVGVISHVPEMQQRILAHLTVTKKEQGSDVRFKILA